MDEIINIKINGNTITKDSNVAGNQYECNSTKLCLTFSDNWDGFGKSITFWNAIGENAVKIQLGMDELEDWGNSRVYIVPIPGEAMTEAGDCSFVIEGEVDGIVKRTASDKLKVKYSPKAENAGNPESVTPDLATQLRNEIDTMYVDIAEIKQVGDEVNAGLGKVEEAVSLVQSAEQSAVAADNSAWGAAIEAENAREAIANMKVESETLPPGSDASVVRTDANGVLGLMFGIPEGNSGVYVGSEEPTDPDVKVWIDTSGEEDTNYVTRDEVDEDLLRQQTNIIAYTDLKYAWKNDLSEYATKEDLEDIDPSSDLNLQNGWGLDSLVQKTSYEDKEGAQSEADGIGAFATGRWNRASADCSVALNYNNNVTGTWALACGYGHTVSGDGGFASGAKNTVGAGGIAATATGSDTSALGRYSFSGGHFTSAIHESSFVMGHFLQSTNAYTAAFGKFNDYSNGKNIFMVGFGANENGRENVLALNREGILEIKPSYIAPAGAEARLKLGKTTLSESGLKALLAIDTGALSKRIGDIETALGDKADKTDLNMVEMGISNWVSAEYATKEELGDIEKALDELHTYAQALIGGTE